MTSRTKAEASALMCPYRFDPTISTGTCITDTCMAWQWDNDGFQYKYQAVYASGDDPVMRITDTVKRDQYIAAGWELATQTVVSDLSSFEREVLRRPVTRTGTCYHVSGRIAEISQ